MYKPFPLEKAHVEEVNEEAHLTCVGGDHHRRAVLGRKMLRMT